MPKHFLSICAIVKNEAPYIREWLAFHRLQGVEHFYLYHNINNVAEDYQTLEEIVVETTFQRDITYRQWPGVKQQCIAYQHCLDTYGADSEWIAFIDVDEFLWGPNWQIKEFLEALNSWDEMATPNNEYACWKNVGAVAVHWLLFGSNGHTEKTGGLVIERFTKRAATVNRHVKSIVRPKAIKSAGKNPHAFYLEPGFIAINERGQELPVEYALTENGSADVLRINHYHVKSFQEYSNRKNNADPNSGRAYSEEFKLEKFRAHDTNDVEDAALRDLYAAKIREKI